MTPKAHKCLLELLLELKSSLGCHCVLGRKSQLPEVWEQVMADGSRCPGFRSHQMCAGYVSFLHSPFVFPNEFTPILDLLSFLQIQLAFERSVWPFLLDAASPRTMPLEGFGPGGCCLSILGKLHERVPNCNTLVEMSFPLLISEVF